MNITVPLVLLLCYLGDTISFVKLAVNSMPKSAVAQVGLKVCDRIVQTEEEVVGSCHSCFPNESDCGCPPVVFQVTCKE